MRWYPRLSAVSTSAHLLAAVAFASPCSWAYETDQFSTPPEPLRDIGQDLSAYVARELQKAVEMINGDVERLPAELEKAQADLDGFIARNPSAPLPRGPRSADGIHSRYQQLKRSRDELRSRLTTAFAPSGIVDYVHGRFGGTFTWQDQRDGIFGLPLSMIPASTEPASYRPGKFSNIYSFSGFHRIISPQYFVFSSTLRVHDVYLGTDKLGHFFNQGYEYYAAYRSALGAGMPFEEAERQAVRTGVGGESSIFGMWVDGVYSNADLAANFAGMVFYRNLLEEVSVEDRRYPPILRVKPEGGVELLEPLPENLLQRYFSDHLNEALNPSSYERPQIRILRRAVRNRCPRALAFYGIRTQAQAREILDSHRTWHGTEYGHRSANMPKIDELCFTDETLEDQSTHFGK